MESYYKDGLLFEQFRVHHHRDFNIRNRAEAFMIDFVKDYLKSPLNATIEQVREAIVEKYHSLSGKMGKLQINDLRVFGTIAGHDNWQEREFTITAPGRSIPSISVYEQVMKDADDDYKPVQNLVFNPKP